MEERAESRLPWWYIRFVIFYDTEIQKCQEKKSCLATEISNADNSV